MKQVVTTKEERYIDLRFFEWTKVVLVEETNMCLKLDLLGAESPVTFTCEILDNAKADLNMYLSTQTAEPDEANHERHVQRMRKFKFTAKKKAAYKEKVAKLPAVSRQRRRGSLGLLGETRASVASGV